MVKKIIRSKTFTTFKQGKFQKKEFDKAYAFLKQKSNRKGYIKGDDAWMESYSVHKGKIKRIAVYYKKIK